MKNFNYSDERFADIQMLRYRLDGFDSLSLREKQLVYYLSEAALWGRDITFDQMGRHNLAIRRLLERLYIYYKGTREGGTSEFKAMEEYLKRVWFSSGIHHHYGSEKFCPGFSKEWFLTMIDNAGLSDNRVTELVEVIFNEEIQSKRTNKAAGVDLVKTSAVNFYEGVSQEEAEGFYRKIRESFEKKLKATGPGLPSFGLNSRLVKEQGELKEETYRLGGRYGEAISHIVYWLEKAKAVASNEQQVKVIELLIEYYKTGDLAVFDRYSIEWLKEHDSRVDFINGFIEVYDDPLGLKGTWEGLVEYRDEEATKRTRTISDNAQWFEDHSPVAPRFRKPVVRGVVANVICAAMLGGEEYPSTAIGINLPNADWIRAEYGSKSITISNITDAYDKAAKGNGFKEEFVIDKATIEMIEKYGSVTDNLHTDLHECLGHGSGQLLPGVSPDALREYHSVIEEARADLYGLYYMADAKLVELGLLPDSDAYKAQYYSYMMNGLLTQLVRIKPGNEIEEAHMRNRALIARWVLENCGGDVELISAKSSIMSTNSTMSTTSSTLSTMSKKTFVKINDYESLREIFGKLLAEIQRIKSEGDYQAAKKLVERYAIKVDPELHKEILARYERLNLAPYKGFINPKLTPITDENGEIIDIKVSYDEAYAEQMLRYSADYSTFI